MLLANLRQHGSVRLFATTLRGEYGADDRGRDLGRCRAATASRRASASRCATSVARLARRSAPAPPLPRSVEQLTELVGRVPLKDIVRETTDLIERLCIEAALELTSDNRASAAEMLGLSARAST